MELFDGVIRIDRDKGMGAEWCRPLLSYLVAKTAEGALPPYVPRFGPMPLQNLCKMALLWQQLGFHEEAGKLAAWLLHLGPRFAPLWCLEELFDEKEVIRLFDQLSSIPLGGLEEVEDLLLCRFPKMQTAFTFSGQGTSLGVIISESVEIRALGPQSLNQKFGIAGRGMDGWMRTAAFSDIWFEAKISSEMARCQLDLRFVGVSVDLPLQFAFYVKAKHIRVGAEEIVPRSLRRFQGEAAQVACEHLRICVKLPHRVEVIPLAGEGCFWNCEFLVLFSIPAAMPQVTFVIEN